MSEQPGDEPCPVPECWPGPFEARSYLEPSRARELDPVVAHCGFCGRAMRQHDACCVSCMDPARLARP